MAVAGRLSEVLRPGDTLARLSGDEFVVVCEDVGSPSQADVIAGRLDAALEGPLALSGVEVRISASIGIAFAGQGADDPSPVAR